MAEAGGPNGQQRTLQAAANSAVLQVIARAIMVLSAPVMTAAMFWIATEINRIGREVVEVKGLIATAEARDDQRFIAVNRMIEIIGQRFDAQARRIDRVEDRRAGERQP